MTAGIRRVRDATHALREWKLTRDGTLLRVADDWCQCLALQRDKHGRGWFANAWVECLAVRDGPILCDARIGEMWREADVPTLGAAFVAEASPRPSMPLTTSIVRGLIGGDDDPRALLAIAVCAVRERDLEAAKTAVARARRSPTAGGLSATWEVAEWANELAARLERGWNDANGFLDETRETSLEDLGRLA